MLLIKVPWPVRWNLSSKLESGWGGVRDEDGWEPGLDDWVENDMTTKLPS